MHLPFLPFGLIDIPQYPFIVTYCFRYLFDTFEYNLPSDVILYFPLVCSISFFSINSSMFLVLIISLFWRKVWGFEPTDGISPTNGFQDRRINPSLPTFRNWLRVPGSNRSVRAYETREDALPPTRYFILRTKDQSL